METSRKGIESGPSRVANPENESKLQPVPLGDGDQIILGPKGDQNLCEVGHGEIVFRPLYVHHQTLCNERFPDSLVIMRLAPPHL